MAKKTTKKKSGVPGDKDKPPTKVQLYTHLAEQTGLNRKQVEQVFDELHKVIKKNLGPRGSRSFTLPGLAKLTVRKRPATKKRMGRNPRTGEPVEIPAKPASKTVGLRALKPLKDMVS